MKSSRLFRYFCFIAICFPFFGCSKTPNLAGRYERQESQNRGEYIEFKKDGTFFAYSPSEGGLSGNYEVNDCTVKLTLQSPSPFIKMGSYEQNAGIIFFQDRCIFSGARNQTYATFIDTDAEKLLHRGEYFLRKTSPFGKDSDALSWFVKSANLGCIKAQSALGLIYHSGLGVEENDKEAVKWYLKAAEQGDLVSQFELGIFYTEGLGVEKDKNEAIKWFQKAAAHGPSYPQARDAEVWLNKLKP